jgi:hypothetical protein
MTRWLFLLPVAMGLFAGGCGGKPDYKRIADDRVEELLFDRYERREAIPFFEERGHFFDADSTTSVDRDVVLPLLQRLAEVQRTEQWVMLKPGATDAALALLVKLPDDSDVVDRMAELVQEADDGFSGFIVQQWGYDWLQMALVDQAAYEFLKKTNPDIDKQR